MEKLRIFINSLESEKQRVDFANKCKTTIGYLRNAIHNKKKLGSKLSVLIEKHSLGKVTRIDLHPDDWIDQWPELKEQNKSNSEEAA